MTLAQRLAMVAWSALIFVLIGPAAGYQFWALVQQPPQVVLLSPSLGWAVAYGWWPALTAGVIFGAAVAMLPARSLALLLAPPLWATLLRLAALGAAAGLAGCVFGAVAMFPPARYRSLVTAAVYLRDGFTLLAWFAVPAGAICGLIMAPVLRVLDAAARAASAGRGGPAAAPPH